VTIVRGTFVDVAPGPLVDASLRVLTDGAVLVRDGTIVEKGDLADLTGAHEDEQVADCRGGLILPGFVDTHVHYPQVRAIGGLGLPLLEWLDRCALPEEARLADPSYAADIADDFVTGLVAAGTTTALVFGAHFAGAVDALFARAAVAGPRITSGLVVSDRGLRPDLLTTPERAYDESRALAERWHERGTARYAVIPRFSMSCSADLLDACGALLKDIPGSWLTSHLNENLVEIAEVGRLHAECATYAASYDDHGLLGSRSVLAHNVHPRDDELDLLAARDAAVAHCPTSNAALGSGLFPLARHLSHGVRVALGTDVGAGTGLSMFKEALQAYFAQQLLGAAGHPLHAAALLHLATRSGAEALGVADVAGGFDIGSAYDAVWLRPPAGSTLDIGIRHASGSDDALAKAFALASNHDLARVWVGGAVVGGRD
jgi:guanine deaminase